MDLNKIFEEESKKRLKEKLGILEREYLELYNGDDENCQNIEKCIKELENILSREIKSKKRKNQEENEKELYLYISVDKKLKHFDLVLLWEKEINERFIQKEGEKWISESKESCHIILSDNKLFLSSNHEFEILISYGANLQEIYNDWKSLEYLSSTNGYKKYSFQDTSHLLPKKLKIKVKSNGKIKTTSEILSESFFIMERKQYYKFKSLKNFYDDLGQLWILEK